MFEIMVHDHLIQSLIFLVRIVQNSSSETSPSPSVSARLISSSSSSSVTFSPSSVATLLRFFTEMNPVLSSSQSMKILLMLARESLSVVLFVMRVSHSPKSMVPFPSVSRSANMVKIARLLASKPKEVIAALSSEITQELPLISTLPPWSESKRSKAVFAAVTSSSVTPFLAQALASNPAFDGAGGWVLAGCAALTLLIEDILILIKKIKYKLNIQQAIPAFLDIALYKIFTNI